jgi:hypothetical protein
LSTECYTFIEPVPNACEDLRMANDTSIWRVGDDSVDKVELTRSPRSAELERILADRLEIVGEQLLLVGRQIPTASGRRIDLLAIDRRGDLYLIELERDRSPEAMIGGILEQAGWVESLDYERIASMYEDHRDEAFETAFSDAFNRPPPGDINRDHQLIIVGTELDNRSIRALEYLTRSRQVPISALLIRQFVSDEQEFLVREWIVRHTNHGRGVSGPDAGEWNGRDYYLSFVENDHRDWDDARNHGFVSAGQGRWYSQSLEMLEPGDRIFVHLPEHGYVGVGEVTSSVAPVTDVTVDVDGGDTPLLDAPLQADAMGEHADDDELREYVVKVDWLATRYRDEAVWTPGFFASQDTVCRLRNRFTVDTLLDSFHLED